MIHSEGNVLPFSVRQKVLVSPSTAAAPVCEEVWNEETVAGLPNARLLPAPGVFVLVGVLVGPAGVLVREGVAEAVGVVVGGAAVLVGPEGVGVGEPRCSP